MSDIRRTWDELIENFPDNDSRLIDAIHVREFVVSAKPHIAPRAPLATDDITQGFDVGRDWIYETSPVEFYKCESAAQGAAVWRKTYPIDVSGGDGTWGSITGDLSGQADLVAALALKADADHSQDMSTITGLSTALDGKSAVGHNHDDRYYTETEVDTIIAGVESSLEEVEAAEVGYDNTTSGLTATDAQAAIDELVVEFEGLETVSGLTNPMVANLVGAGYEVQDVVYRGFQDTFYDLATDPNTLITTGVASLVSDYNAYVYNGLASELTIELPAEPVGALSPFGIISVNLASGGSIVIDDTIPFVWGKAALADSDPTIPSTTNSTFSIRYRWEPLLSSYVLGLEVLPDSVGGGGGGSGTVEVVGFGVSTLSALNKDVHNYTYNYVSETQDGSVYALVFFFTDSPLSGVIDSSVYDNQLDQLALTSIPNNAIWAGIYKPSSGDLSGGTLALTFNYTNECAQIAVLEISGAAASSPVSFTNVATVSSGTAIGPLAITSGGAGTLLVSLAITDESRALSVTNANSFTQHALVAESSALGGYSVHSRVVDAAGSVNSPTYAGTPADRMNMLVLAVDPE